MKRIITFFIVVLLFASIPLFAKGSTLISAGHDITFPMYEDFGDVFRGDLVASFATVGAYDGGVGFYNFNSLRVPFYIYDKDFGFSKVDLSKDLDLYLSTITGLDVVLPIGSTLEVILGVGAWVEVDYMKDDDFLFMYAGPAARADLVFNISRNFFLDFGVEAQYMLYLMFYDLESKEYDAGPVKEFSYPSCGLRFGIRI